MLDDDRAATRLGQFCSMRLERSLEEVLIRLQGEFDLSCVKSFQEQVAGAVEGVSEMLILDLCGLTFIDSTGLRMLVTLNKATRDHGVDFVVLSADGHVRRVLRETGLDGVLPVVGSAGDVPRSDSPV